MALIIDGKKVEPKLIYLDEQGRAARIVQPREYYAPYLPSPPIQPQAEDAESRRRR